MSMDNDESGDKSDINEPIPNTTQPSGSSIAQDTIFASSPAELTSSSSLSNLSGSISSDGSVDPITEAIRKEILRKQRDILKDYFVDKKIESELVKQSLKVEEGRQLTSEELAEEEEKDENFRTFLSNPNNRQLINGAFEDSDTKKKLEAAEIVGYRTVLTKYSAENYKDGFRPIPWENQISAGDLRATVVKNGVGEEICTLSEKTHRAAPITLKQGDKEVTINSYRTIDFPVKLEGKSGTMHLSMVALDENGQRPPVDQAVYFTAHYEESLPNGTPKLKEISSPQPLKFFGEGNDAVGYIEHGGKIYTLPVTRGNYEEMMKEVAINKWQSVDISQTLAPDQFKVLGGEKSIASQQIDPIADKPIEYENTEIPKPQPVPPVTSINTPKQPEVSQMPQPQQVGNLLISLPEAMQALLGQFNKDLKNEVDKTGLIGHVAEKILQDKEERQTGIQALSDDILKSENLTPDAKIQGIGAILKTINDDNVLSEPEKAKLLERIAATALNATNLEKDHRQKILENVAESALGLKDETSRANALNGVVDNIIGSKLGNEEKWQILTKIDDKVNASGRGEEEKSKLRDSILQKSVQANILDPGQQQLMQQNSDKVISEQQKENVIKDVQSILANPAFNTISKAEAIKDITTDVLDSPAKPEVKGEIIESLAGAVANSNFLDIKGKAEIVKGIGETIASHNTLPTAEKVTVIESVEKGIANSNAVLEDKKQMMTGLVDGIYNSATELVVKSELTKAVISAIPEDKNALKDAANEAILNRETQNLDKDLQRQNLNKDLSQNLEPVYEATKGMADALKGVIDPILEAHPEKREVSKEEIIQQTSNILSNVSNFVRDKVSSLRNILEPNNNFKTIEEKRAELIENFNSKSTLEEKQNFIETNLINDKTLSKDARLQVINNLLEGQAEKRGVAVSGQSQDKTEDVRTLSEKSELRPVSKDEPDIEKAKMVMGQDKVNIKDNVKIMETLMNAKNTIQSESASVSSTKISNNKKGPSFL